MVTRSKVDLSLASRQRESAQRKLAPFERQSTLEVQRLTGALRASGLNLAEVAAEIDVSPRQITAWRSGENQAPHAAVMALRALLDQRTCRRAA